ncbi:MAG: Re/Si-specific NAD(P)(+) transhydrogenase subunit alpha [Thermoplasmata archaeon]|nr:Re/Si-specific NAD(P)(+) transhydrogenase subunit alpha [Thermoplasmata archaeon]MCI4333120.1 Re/Si-specific NAD(P)(+) transhydrogenase subunit alpha [Thermoplasmata archaeon]
MGVVVAVPKETAPGERRVASVPEVVQKLVKSGVTVRVESGAGVASNYPDEAYTAAGATLVDRATLLSSAGILLTVQPPAAADLKKLPSGSIVLGFLSPGRNLDAAAGLRDAKLTGFAVELIPRISRAQSMDALSSQATVGGYRAALIGADHSPKFLPMLTTAAGTIRPSKVLILGAGVAGLMAIATARRLGAVVEGYDVRRAAGEQVRSLGAKFLELQINAEGQGGYARELTPEEKAQESEMVAKAVAEADIVITTANIPGKKAPRLVTKEMVARMRPGSVIVDLAAETGGNCELTQAGQVVVSNGVQVVGPLNLPSDLAYHASMMYAKNLASFLALLVGPTGERVASFDDEILKASVLVEAGEVRHEATRAALGASA